MTFVSEDALRDLIRESLSTSEDQWTPLDDLEGLPVLVNPSLDSSLAKVDGSVVDVQFVPHDKTEFEVAVRSLTKNLPDDVIATLYKKFRDLVSDVEESHESNGACGGVEEMKKTNEPSEAAIVEAVRKMVRKVLAEELDGDESPVSSFRPPASTKVPAGIAGARKRVPALAALEDEIEDALMAHQQTNDPDTWEEPLDDAGREAHRKMIDREEGVEVDPWDTSDVDALTKSDWDPDADAEADLDEPKEEPKPEEKKKANRRKLDHGVGNGDHGKSFDDIATELGFSPSGMKRLEHVALAKVAYMMDLGPDEASELVLDAVDDYITMLAKTGELDEDEVNYMYQHGDMVAELDGFREYLHGVIRKEMKKDGIEFYPKLDDKGKPVLDASGAQVQRGKKDGDAGEDENESASPMGEEDEGREVRDNKAPGNKQNTGKLPRNESKRRK